MKRQKKTKGDKFLKRPKWFKNVSFVQPTVPKSKTLQDFIYYLKWQGLPAGPNILESGTIKCLKYLLELIVKQWIDKQNIGHSLFCRTKVVIDRLIIAALL